MSAWIEINQFVALRMLLLVALYMSAWIEISVRSDIRSHIQRRTLHECVD